MDISGIASVAVQLLAPVLMAVLACASAWLAALIRTKVKNEFVKGVMLRLDDAVFAAVKEVEQVIVARLKEASADGTITAQERAAVKSAAIASVKEQLGQQGLMAVSKAIGDGLDAVLGAKVEAAVHDIKAGAARSDSL
jgi:hypothetical protein